MADDLSTPVTADVAKAAAREIADRAEAERTALADRIAALEANGSELLARAERAEAVVAALPDPSTAEELREKITELFGSPDEALLHAFLDYAWSETARIAGWEMAARWQAEGERDALKAARCPSCDHLTSHHQPDGCWYAVTSGTPGRDLVCSCEVAAPTPTEETDRIAKERIADVDARCVCDRSVHLADFDPHTDCPIHTRPTEETGDTP